MGDHTRYYTLPEPYPLRAGLTANAIHSYCGCMVHTMREAEPLLHSRNLRQMGKIVHVDPPSLEKIFEKIGDVQVKIPDFVSALKDICRQTTGYGFVVYDVANPKPIADKDGFAVREIKTKFTPSTRLNVHSISKTVCAAAITRALHLNEDVTLHSAISPYLRPRWNIPENSAVRKITFEELLTHNSGLKDLDSDSIDERSLEGIRRSLLNGIDEPRDSRTYQNVNFSLCRILLPHIDNDGDSDLTKDNLDQMDETTFDNETIEFFLNYVRKYFFNPIGGLAEPMWPEEGAFLPSTRYYDFKSKDPSPPEPLPSTSPAHIGASSWSMSALEYGKFIHGLRFLKTFGRNGENWSPWETMVDYDRRIKSSSSNSAIYRLGMTDEDVGLAKGVVGLGKAGGGSATYGPTTGWIAFSNLTAVLLINCKGGVINSHLEGDENNLELTALDALRLAVRSALKGI